MLEADGLNQVAILMLTSQCWDHDLVARVHAKLARELAPGAIIVDYTDALLRQQEHTCFEMVAHVQAPVSWNDEHTFYVVRKK